MFDKPDSFIKLFSYSDDLPRDGKGTLIPPVMKGRPRTQFSPAVAVPQATVRPGLRMVVIVFATLFLMVFGVTGYGLASKMSLEAAPIVSIIDPYTEEVTDLIYGPQAAFEKAKLFIETRDAFIDEGLSFIEIDLTSDQLRFFRKGILLQSSEILAEGEVGSWWETPAGLYELEEKSERSFTNISQVYLPWQLTFQGNFVVHGWPSYSDGIAVEENFVGGGIRLSNQDAEELFRNVRVGTPVIVRTKSDKERDIFIYEPQVPELNTPHYFIADIDNGTILAATDLNEPAPIASLTKLMTAVVASEHIDLDGRVRVGSPTFVTSLIPRLSERSTVSMYSLLQLLLVESSNEAAETIAGEFGRDEFITAMNDKARQLGMMNTTFADPSGLSADNVSSIGDLYRLARYIHQDRSFIYEITANKELPSAYVGGEFDGLINFNEVKDLDSFVGGKVGETNAAGQTSVSLHEVMLQGEERTVVVILLGSDGRSADIKTLLTYVQNRFGR